MSALRSLLLLLLTLALALPVQAQEDDARVTDTNYRALELRGIGPAFPSGRIADMAMHPDNDAVWYVAVGSGGVWKTENAGTTWSSLFDGQGSYSIGCITLDPANPHVVWVGTGENVGGRHVGYGDGLYRSQDGGQTWTNMGLKDSEHISKIVIHPEDSNTLWVAAQGPLWSPGGERGLYKSTDGGQTWTRTLGDDEWVGVTDLVIDPRDPDVVYAATWQRHRNVASYLGGGPGSGLHKSTDGGDTWTELKRGLPSSNMGKIGLAISYHNPDHLFAAIELDRREGGVYMSSDRGASWTKQSDAVSGATGPHYYQELYTTPHAEGRLYLMDVRVQVSDDFGKTFRRLNERDKHSDNHAIAFRADDPDYILMGTDGGLYESFDGAATWKFIDNLPITQYYKVAVDDALPFYNVYGGTQDNGSHGGPSRTDNRHGIRNADWFKTLGADGHQSATEPGNPNIVYAETQQGGLHRIDRVTGEQVYIQPQSREGEPRERYNWDAPIVVSPHDPATLYFASQRVWKSTNRGDSWVPVSGDLTRDQERFELPIMGRVQSWDNAWDLNAMSVYNTITSLSESPLAPGLLYVGTDDGLLQVSEDDGGSWRSIEVGTMPGVPATAFVNHVYADLHDADVVYVALDNHKFGDLEPYLLKSTDRGRSWTSMAETLPERTLIWRVVQDHVDPDLLFTATEFGLYFTVDGGAQWVQLQGGAPTIAFRDLTIQRRENDLVAASFGRGFFILDDYSPLRSVSEDLLAQEAHLFDTREAQLYVPRDVHGRSMGTDYYAAPNPDFGAVFTYYLRDGATTLKAERRKQERAMAEDEDIPFPGWDALEAEVNEVPDRVDVVVRDASGQVINRVKGRTSAGFHRVAWNLRHAAQGLIEPGERSGNDGFMVTPGTYTATLTKTADGVVTELGAPITFDVVPLHEPTLQGAPPAEIIAFREQMEALQVEMATLGTAMDEQMERLEAMQTALGRARQPDPALTARLHEARGMLLALERQMSGYQAKRDPGERTEVSARSRFFVGYRGLSTTYGPTEMHRASVDLAEAQLAALQQELDTFMQTVMPPLETALGSTDAPRVLGTGTQE
ncbi:MAG: glycosyl hydrolase [Bacteroidota bacterium]